MGEIKSTLDLVLERTRNLNLSDSEKHQLKLEEFRKRIRGLIIRFQKGDESLPSIEAQLQKDGVEFGLDARREFFCELLREVRLDGDNALLLRLARQVCNHDTRDIEAILSSYAEAVSSASNHRKGIIRQELAQARGIRGDAVVPHLAVDPEWLGTLEQIRTRHLRRLAGVSEKADCG